MTGRVGSDMKLKSDVGLTSLTETIDGCPNFGNNLGETFNMFNGLIWWTVYVFKPWGPDGPPLPQIIWVSWILLCNFGRSLAVSVALLSSNGPVIVMTWFCGPVFM